MHFRSILLSFLCICLLSSPVIAKRKSFFAKGRARMSLSLGSSSSLNGNAQYFNLGAGFGYFFKKGMESGLHGNFLFGSNPNFYIVTGHVNVFWVKFSKSFKPYIGPFLRRVWADGGEAFQDLGYLSVGLRAGIYYVPSSSGLYIGAGLAGEHRFDCNSSDARIKCNWFYPELQMGFIF
jgi:hypothetical protein